MNWTKEQQSVIDVRDRNVLVSAAAGSGKTAVLVERIMQIVMNKDNPVDIDKLLVVTFTNAAAKEMRQRILQTLENAVDEMPDDDVMKEHLEKQCTYIHNAKITTIDSFCLDVIREHISETDIDPAFRIADNSEITLMTEDAIRSVLDEHYESMDEDFMDFVSTYSSKVGDDKIEKMVTSLYRYSQSYPDPEQWIKECGSQYEIDEDHIEECNWVKFVKSLVKDMVEECKIELSEALQKCTAENGIEKYAEAIRGDMEFLQELEGKESIKEILECIKNFAPASLKPVRNANEEAKNEVKDKRDNFKSKIVELKEKYCTFSIKQTLKNLSECRKSIEVLTNLTLEFGEEFKRLKKDKNIMDFSDIEHIALGILTDKKDNEYVITETAKEMAEDFVEIMIDEYQDSNFVQEMLLTSVSKCHMGKNNIFMVGDIKQSIYKFRLARPELFLEKYDTYPTDYSEDKIKIVLTKNFRSRQEVIDSANLVFKQIMSKSLGGIEYDEESMLYCGAAYDDYGNNQKAELIMIDNSKEKLGQTGSKELAGKSREDVDDELGKLEFEAVVVANRIKELVNGDKSFMVKDKTSGEMRKATYGDIVILFRNKKGNVETYMDVLSAKGIPVSSSIKESLLNTFEINVILNFLSIIDNPRQDIPLVSVLKNVFGYSENELAEIRYMAKEAGVTGCFYDDFVHYEGNLADKNEKVLEFMNKYRHYSTYMSIHKLIKIIIDETGFFDFVSSMKNGDQRLYNIDIFIEKAKAYSEGVYTGLFNFIRYIEKIKMYNAEQNEDVALADDDSVKLMSIHKSKGLEFPIVFVAATGKQYSKQDVRSKVVIHSSLGIGVDRVDLDKRIKYKTVIKEMILEQIKEENLAEELRVLYVALTRAKEKLIVVGSGQVSSKIKKYMQYASRRKVELSKEMLMTADSILDLMIMSLVRHKSFANINKLVAKNSDENNAVWDMPGTFDVTLLDMDNIAYDSVVNITETLMDKEALKHWDSNIVYSDAIREKLNERFSYVYKYENDTRIRAKHSVSDIKHSKMEIDEFAENKMHLSEDDEEYIPEFMREDNAEKESANGGALRGSAVHRFFELFDYDRESYELTDIQNMMDNIRDKQTMSDMELDLITPKIFVMFMKNGLGQRMQAAHKNKLLFRERPFVMGMKAREVDETYDSDELVIVQGIIDAFFYEGNEVVIVDYKTDNVDKREELIGRYKAQLDCYADAIRKVTGKEVKEKLIYSTKFDDTIIVE